MHDYQESVVQYCDNISALLLKLDILFAAGDISVIIDENILSQYPKLSQKLDEYKARIMAITATEDTKSFKTVGNILDFLVNSEAATEHTIIAIGGGVITDISGFCAAIYKRGINFIAIPTTLLAMCDAAIGGKNGVNFAGNKNVIGTIRQAQEIIVCPFFANTLSKVQFNSGMAEIIKIAMLFDHTMLNDIVTDLDLKHIIMSAINWKLKIVANDEQDFGIRKMLNYGHTVGHAIESAFDFKIEHGLAVAIGMIIENDLMEDCENSYNTNCLLLPLIQDFSLDQYIKNIPFAELSNYIKHDKKRSKNVIDMVFFKDKNTAELRSIDLSKIEHFLINYQYRY